MSSSRWRRFAFFDRSTLSLPEDVLDDLFPPHRSVDEDGAGTSALQRQQPRQLRVNTNDNGVANSYEENSDDSYSLDDNLGGGSGAERKRLRNRISLACGTVSFHPSIVISKGSGGTVGSEPDSSSTGTTGGLHVDVGCVGVGAGNNTPLLLPSAMTSACAPPDQKTSRALGMAINELTCGIVPADNASSMLTLQRMTHSPLSGSLAFVYPPHPPSHSVSGGSTATATAATPTTSNDRRISVSSASPSSSLIDRIGAAFDPNGGIGTIQSGTLVLAFVSSRDSELVHCVDVSMRCNPAPPPTVAQPDDSVKNSLYGAVGGAAGGEEAPRGDDVPSLADVITASEELEDLDGWRGCVRPFPVVQTTGAVATATATGAAAAAAAASATSGVGKGLSAKERIIMEHMSSPAMTTKNLSTAVAAIGASGGVAGSVSTFGKSKGCRIVGVAACNSSPYYHESAPASAAGRKELGKSASSSSSQSFAAVDAAGGLTGGYGNLLVAAVTDQNLLSTSLDANSTSMGGVCIMVDPHLHLQTAVVGAKSASPDSSSAPQPPTVGGMIIYRPSQSSVSALLGSARQQLQKASGGAAGKVGGGGGMSPAAKRIVRMYKPTCVAVSPHYVAVGTRGGAVLVYSYPSLGNVLGKSGGGGGANAASSSSGKASAASSSGSGGISPTLNLWMEIPHAGGDGDEGRAVSGVHLVYEPDEVVGVDSAASQNSGGAGKKGSATSTSPGVVFSPGPPRANRLYVTYCRRRGGGRRGGRRGKGPTASVGVGTATVPNSGKSASEAAAVAATSASTVGQGGAADTPWDVCCYDLIRATSTAQTAAAAAAPPSSSSSSSGDVEKGGAYRNVQRGRNDLDSREAASAALCDVDYRAGLLRVAWSDGLYTYNTKHRISAVPMDGTKIAMCCLPSSTTSHEDHGAAVGAAAAVAAVGGDEEAGDVDGAVVAAQTQRRHAAAFSGSAGNVGYSLVATTDLKSGRDAVDIYDTINKLVAFHVLLSPKHEAVQVAGLATPPSIDGRNGRSSAIVVTSGGAVVTLTERDTAEKVSLLVQKNLYAAAISLAFADSNYPIRDIVSLYRQHAEHLYRKGDFESSMEQYIYTIGSLEPSHVIFRFLDAPKIPLLARYLEHLRLRNVDVDVHNELLRTCYLKLNDVAAAEKIVVNSSSLVSSSSSSRGGGGGGSSSSAIIIASNLVDDKPAEAFATLCTLEAPQVAEALTIHGATLARALPRETAGIVMSLCDGTYSPDALAQSSSPSSSSTTPTAAAGTGAGAAAVADEASILENNLFLENRKRLCERYPVNLFTCAFLENPRLLRLILAHCRRNKCDLTPDLRRTHLELTLEEWKAAQRKGDYDLEKIRCDEAMTALTDSHAEELGDYEALVIVQMAGFTQGEVLLYEKLQMSNMLLERYANEGGERERRQMLAMSRSDPELLADVLGYFVTMASERGHGGHGGGGVVSFQLCVLSL